MKADQADNSEKSLACDDQEKDAARNSQTNRNPKDRPDRKSDEMQDPKRPQDDNEMKARNRRRNLRSENARPKAGDTKCDQQQNPDSQQNQEKNSDSDQNRKEKSSKQQQQQNKDDQQQSDDNQQQKGGQGKTEKLGAREVRRTARARRPLALSRARTCAVGEESRKGSQASEGSERGESSSTEKGQSSESGSEQGQEGGQQKGSSQGKMASHRHPARKNNLKAESPVRLHRNARIRAARRVAIPRPRGIRERKERKPAGRRRAEIWRRDAGPPGWRRRAVAD